MKYDYYVMCVAVPEEVKVTAKSSSGSSFDLTNAKAKAECMVLGLVSENALPIIEPEFHEQAIKRRDNQGDLWPGLHA
jgi:hypothetical protein